MLLSDMAPHHGMPWSAARPLRWSDFQGAPRHGGDEAAKTAYGIYYAWKCRGRAFQFRAVAAFHTQESWVQPAVAGDIAEGPRTLAHEQTHFDIAEVYARRMRRHFRELAEPCAQSDANLAAGAVRLLDEEKAMQHRYDAETAHGLRRTQQAAWETEIRRQLHLAETRFSPASFPAQLFRVNWNAMVRDCPFSCQVHSCVRWSRSGTVRVRWCM
jgi:hypothetical protein